MINYYELFYTMFVLLFHPMTSDKDYFHPTPLPVPTPFPQASKPEPTPVPEMAYRGRKFAP